MCAIRKTVNSSPLLRSPLLGEKTPDDDPIDLSSVDLSYYRLTKIKQQDLMMQYLNNKELQAGFQRVVFDMLLAKGVAVP